MLVIVMVMVITDDEVVTITINTSKKFAGV